MSKYTHARKARAYVGHFFSELTIYYFTAVGQDTRVYASMKYKYSMSTYIRLNSKCGVHIFNCVSACHQHSVPLMNNFVYVHHIYILPVYVCVCSNVPRYNNFYISVSNERYIMCVNTMFKMAK